MHGDEANQAMKTGVLLETGAYAYDPYEHHGPTLYYLTLLILWVNGVASKAEMTEPMIRVLPTCFGLGLVLLSWVIVAPIDRRAALLATFFTAISHGLVYYSRYYIQEMSFVFFAAGLVWCGYHYLRTPRLGWALGAGAFLGLLHATKETSVLVVAAMLGGVVCVLVYERVVGRDTGKNEETARAVRRETQSRRGVTVPPYLLYLREFNWKHLGGALGVALVVSVVFFSSFFTHWRGPLDSILTYSTYLGRAEGHGSTGIHEHPWYYYLWLLGWYYREAGPKWSEGLILGLALVGVVWGLWRPLGGTCATDRTDQRNHASEAAEGDCAGSTRGRSATLLERFLIFYALLLLAGFSIIPYKTPWNLLIFLHPLCLLAGLGAYRLVFAARAWWWRGAVALLLALGSVQLLGQTWRGVFTYGADVRNPYVYAHTSSAIRRLVERVDSIAAVHPRGNAIHINVFRPNGDYWPLPWYFRAYPNVGYWPGLPENCDADIVLTSPEAAPAVHACLAEEYHIENHGLRPGVLMPTFIRKDLWDAFMADRQEAPAGSDGE